MLKARASALPAIAAAMALSSTLAMAQEVQPTEPTPVTTESPPPVVDASPAVADPIASDPTVAEPLAPVAETAVTTKPASRPVKSRTAAKAASVPAPVATPRTATRVPTAHAVAETPAEPVSAPAVEPVAVAAAPAVARTPRRGSIDDTELALGGGALALLALGSAGFALSRRRRPEEEEEWVDQPLLEQESLAAAQEEAAPFVEREQTPILAPSAFTWGRTEPAQQAAGRDPEDDRLPGETWVERAYRGPSVGNPSVSLKHRLRRAAFFDKRERDVAAGIAEPVEIDAGLPAAATEKREREFA